MRLEASLCSSGQHGDHTLPRGVLLPDECPGRTGRATGKCGTNAIALPPSGGRAYSTATRLRANDSRGGAAACGNAGFFGLTDPRRGRAVRLLVPARGLSCTRPVREQMTEGRFSGRAGRVLTAAARRKWNHRAAHRFFSSPFSTDTALFHHPSRIDERKPLGRKSLTWHCPSGRPHSTSRCCQSLGRRRWPEPCGRNPARRRCSSGGRARGISGRPPRAPTAW